MLTEATAQVEAQGHSTLSVPRCTFAADYDEEQGGLLKCYWLATNGRITCSLMMDGGKKCRAPNADRTDGSGDHPPNGQGLGRMQNRIHDAVLADCHRRRSC